MLELIEILGRAFFSMQGWKYLLSSTYRAQKNEYWGGQPKFTKMLEIATIVFNFALVNGVLILLVVVALRNSSGEQ